MMSEVKRNIAKQRDSCYVMVLDKSKCKYDISSILDHLSYQSAQHCISGLVARAKFALELCSGEINWLFDVPFMK